MFTKALIQYVCIIVELFLKLRKLAKYYSAHSYYTFESILPPYFFLTAYKHTTIGCALS